MKNLNDKYLNDKEKTLLLFIDECMEDKIDKNPNPNYMYNELYTTYLEWCKSKKINHIIDKVTFNHWFDYENKIYRDDKIFNYKYLVLTNNAKKLYLKKDNYKLWLTNKIEELKKKNIINNNGKGNEEVIVYTKIYAYDMDYNHAGEELFSIFNYCVNKGYRIKEIVCDFIPYYRHDVNYKFRDYQSLPYFVEKNNLRIVTTNLSPLTEDHDFFKKFTNTLEEYGCKLELMYDDNLIKNRKD